jgi:FtsP/CotA-like multicopper oxidase with cupredoxin domain
MGDISRRQAIKLGLAAAAVGALPGALTGWDPTASGPPGRSRAGEFHQPAVKSSAYGVLAVRLTAVPGEVDIGAAKPVGTYTYDGGLPGSTWVVNPGDTLRIELVNNLPPLHHATHLADMDRPHEWPGYLLNCSSLGGWPRGSAR